MSKRCGIYARVSTEGQADNTSLGGQVEVCRKYAEQIGYTVVEDAVVAEQISGTTSDRTGMNKLFELAAGKRIDAVILAKVDRLARQRKADAYIQAELESYGVHIVFVGRDTSTRSGRLLVNVEKDFAEYEHGEIVERNYNGKLRALRERHRVMGTAYRPFGYNYIRGEYRYEVNEQEAEWLQRAFAMAAEGATLYSIAQTLTNHGVRTATGRARWHTSTVAGILSNELYTGVYHWNKRQAVAPRNPIKEARRYEKSSRMARPREEWIAVSGKTTDPRTGLQVDIVPALVSTDVFQAAQEARAGNRRRGLDTRKSAYLLRGLVFCGRCGARMNGRKSGGYRYYSCYRYNAQPQRAAADRCTLGYVRADRLEDAVWGQVARQVSDIKVIRRAMRELVEQSDEARTQVARELERILLAERKLDTEKQRLLDIYLSGDLDADLYRTRAADLRKRADDLGEDKARAQHASHAAGAGGAAVQERVEEMAALAQRGLPLLDTEGKADLLRALDVRVTTDGEAVQVAGLIGDALTHILSDGAPISADGFPTNRNKSDASDMLIIPFTASFALCGAAPSTR